MRRRHLLLSLLLALLLSGCASVSLVASWKDPATPVTRYQTLLVVGITENVQTRQLFEEVMADRLRGRGVTAIPGYTVAGSAKQQSREALEEALKKSRADAVVTTRITSRKKATDTRAGYTMTDRGFANPYLSDYDVLPWDLYGFYGATVSYATFDSKPVEVTTSRTLTLETNLFDARSERLVWSATTTIEDPKGVITASKELSDTVINAMRTQGVLP